MDTRYDVRLTVNKNDITLLDCLIGCENAQQLDQAKRVVDDRLIHYIAMFAVESSLTGGKKMPDEPDEETENPAEVEAEPDTADEEPEQDDEDVAEETRPVEAEERKPRQLGAKGLLKLYCKGCGRYFGTFLKDPKMECTCKCGNTIALDNLAKFEYECPKCGKFVFGHTNIEDGTMDHNCICGAENTLIWNTKRRIYE